MLLEARYIVAYVRGLMAHTDETWELLAEGKVDASKKEFMMNHYYWPLFGVTALLVLILIGLGGLFGDGMGSFDLERGMKAMVLYVVVYAVGPMLISMCVNPLVSYVTGRALDREQVELFAHYTMSILMVLEVCCSVFPNLEFLGFSKLYIIYIIARGILKFFGIDGREWAVISAIFVILFYVAPIIIQFLFNYIDSL